MSKAKALAAASLAALLALSGCGNKWSFEDELDEAVFVSFVETNGDRTGSDEFFKQEAFETCERLARGEKYQDIAEQAKTADYPMYEVAILVGATTWLCTEFEE